jgi:hypothetical protein
MSAESHDRFEDRTVPSHDYPALIAELDPSDADGFHDLLVRMLGDLEMPAIDMCEEFDVSLATVSRWIDGQAAPAPQLRRLILMRLGGLISHTEYAIAC